jgi:hypothetical protein
MAEASGLCGSAALLETPCGCLHLADDNTFAAASNPRKVAYVPARLVRAPIQY